MSVIIRWFLALAYLAGLFGMSCFLIYSQVSGWGWFLFVVALVAGGTSIEITKSDKDKEEE